MTAVTAFILINCVFWAGMDVVVYGVEDHWTVYRIYLPVIALFLPILWAWIRLAPRGLAAAAVVCGLVGLALTGYAVFLLMTQPVWGVVTLIFVPLFVVLGLTSARYARKLGGGVPPEPG